MTVIAGCACALAAGAVSVALTPAHAGGDYRVDVIFDDARGLIPGQLVQIAGARVGTIEDVSLTPDFKARVHLTVQSRYAPFRRDATCTIRPQGLIAENYVNCDPGSPDAPPLTARGDHPPTVPVDRTTQPVQVTDLFDVWKAPVRDRLTLLVDALGMGTAGRGADLNAILRRANPSLTLARRIITTLERQKDDLATILDRSDEVAGALARNSGRVRDFLDEAATTAAATGPRERSLAETVRRLPGLLAAADPALRDLDAVVRTGTPVVHQVRVAAPDINRLNADLHPLAQQVVPTVRRLGPVVRVATASLRKAAPVTRLLRSYTGNSLPAALSAGELFPDLQAHGFVENFLSVIYRGAAATSRFDSVGHVFPAFVKLNACILPATTENRDCTARFTHDAARRRSAPRRAPQRTTAPPTAAAPAPAAPGASAPAPLRDTIGAVQGAVDDLVQGILGPRDEGHDRGLGGLLGYLLR